MKQTFFIAGVQHRPSKGIVEGLAPNVKLGLLPEPTNKYDPNAIRIMFKGTMLGYVPAKLCDVVHAGLMIHESNLQCTLTTYSPESKPWERLEVTIEPKES